jgi:transcriptional regulator with XRE-family HTH domain
MTIEWTHRYVDRRTSMVSSREVSNGSSETPLDPGEGPVQQFANDLRRLREQAGSPTYRQLAERAHYSPAALSQAAAGRTMPSLPVTLAFVEACGGDREEWEHRWQQVRTGGDETDPEGGDETDPAARRRWPVLVGLPVVVLLVAVGTAVFVTNRPAAVAGPTPTKSELPVWQSGPEQPVADGSDPKRAHCDTDVRTLATATTALTGGVVAGDVELRYSPGCDTAWARFTPTPSLPADPTILVTVTTERPADDKRRPFTVSNGGLAIIGDILLLAKGCVAAHVVLRQNDQQLADATTACRAGP